MIQGKRRAVAVPPRFLHDDAYRAQVLADLSADIAREATAHAADLQAAAGEGRGR